MLMDQLVSVLYNAPNIDRAKTASILERHAGVAAVYNMRLLPLLDARLNARGFRCQRHAHADALLKVISLIHQNLSAELEWFISSCEKGGIPVAPIKGTHQLLWGQGLRDELHTRDLDLLIDERNYAKISSLLSKAGYRQLGWISLKTGEMRDVTSSQLMSEEPPGYYGHFPWTRLIRVADLDENLPILNQCVGPREQQPLRLAPDVQRHPRNTYPVIVINGAAHVAVQFDLHHSLWPGTAFGELRFEDATWANHSVQRLSLRDRLVFHSTHMATRLMGGGWIPGWGAFAQLVFTMQTEGNSEVYDECQLRANQVMVGRQWSSVAALVRALAIRCGADVGALPGSTQHMMQQADADFAKQWLLVLEGASSAGDADGSPVSCESSTPHG